MDAGDHWATRVPNGLFHQNPEPREMQVRRPIHTPARCRTRSGPLASGRSSCKRLAAPVREVSDQRHVVRSQGAVIDRDKRTALADRNAAVAAWAERYQTTNLTPDHPVDRATGWF